MVRLMARHKIRVNPLSRAYETQFVPGAVLAVAYGRILLERSLGWAN
jgi:hypothetical protein